MRRFSIYAVLLLAITLSVGHAQVRPEYLYNANLPFGTLDIRTRINDSDYYYLVEGKTFSFRETAPGIPTESYLKMTNFDTSPYTEGHMRRAKGGDDTFEMNYRFLFPRGHQSGYQPGYPLIVLMHGAVERANCYYEECYHGGWEYDPNANFPPAPTDADHPLLNNDHHLAIGAREHLAARNRAGDRLPDDPSMPERAFPGFVLMPQMFNDWDSLWVEKVLRMVQLHVEKYNIDPNRIYIHGLSIGGYATYEAIKRAPWLFAAALPMSAVSEAANIFEHNQQNRVSHIPLWVFQGGKDTEPTVGWTKGVLQKFRDAGSSVRYTEYPGIGHNVWGWAYAETDFFSWMLQRNKADIHARFQVTEINKKENQFPELVLAEGFFAYQWEKDGKIIAGASTHQYIPTEEGTYRARFSRVPSPATSDWNRWSNPITITRIDEEEVPEEEVPEEEEPEEEPEEEEPGEDLPDDEQPDDDDQPEEEPTDEDQPGEDDSDDEGAPTEEEPGNDGGDSDQPTDGDEDGESDEDAEGGDEDGEPDPDSSGDEDPDGEEDPENTDDGGQHTGTPGEEGDGVITNLPDEMDINVAIYPNPVSSQSVTLDIRNPSGQPIDYTVVDALGRIRIRGQIAGSREGERHVLELSQTLGDGVYIFSLRQGKIELKKRIIVRNQ